MGNSATGGYIRERPGVWTRAAIEDVVHDMLVGLTGFSNEIVRPAFQHEPLKDPPSHVDWCAFDVRSGGGVNDYPDVRHIPDGDGSDEVMAMENRLIYIYFYGPHADDFAAIVRRSLHIEQNRWAMRQAGIAVRSVGEVSPMPELVNAKWLRRADLGISVTIEARGQYDVFNLVRATGSIVAETASMDFDTNNQMR